MGRTVGTDYDATETVYLTLDDDGLDEYGSADVHAWFLVELTDALQAAFPSFYPVNKWPTREGKTILENGHARVPVYEYCGLYSVNLTADAVEHWPIARAWAYRAAAKFRETVQGTPYIADTLRRVGTFSNGNGVYERTGA